MSEQSVPVNRTLLGMISAACLVAGLVIMVVDSYANMWSAAFLRVGLVTGAFWIALPSRGREAAWTNVSPQTLLIVLLAGLLFVSRPRIFLILLIPLCIIGFLLRPRNRHRMRDRSPH
ncbi:MAG: hypothetical protein KF861_01030 [Planctomycetaceae bacterium]|nr:hypothetical protein [Planctomycetaceae bacterium]